MALLFELFLTAALTLLAAFLLATFFAANDARREPDRAAAAIFEDEERIIEVKLSERSGAAVSAPEAEGWVEVVKAPVVVVKEEEPECSPEPDEDGVPVRAARAGSPGAGLERQLDVAEKRCDLTAAAATTGVVDEAKSHVLPAEAVHSDVLGRVQDVGAKHRDLDAESAPSEALAVQTEKKQVLATKLEGVEAEQQHLVSEVSPSAEVLVAGTSQEIPDVVLEKKEDQTVQVKENELVADAVHQAALDAPLAEKKVLQVQQPSIEEAREEVQNKEQTNCEIPPADQVPEEELVVMKTGDAEVTHEGSSTGKVATELPMEAVTLQEPPRRDVDESDTNFGEWEGIEMSEVEKRFGAAAAFAASEAGTAALSKLDSDVRLELEGLLKVAVDGPCYDPTQPLTLRPSSRAKWYHFSL
jgi:hypothetical protein